MPIIFQQKYVFHSKKQTFKFIFFILSHKTSAIFFFAHCLYAPMENFCLRGGGKVL